MGPASGEVSSGYGRRDVRIGIDLGGTKIEGIALDGSRQCARLRIDTPRDDYAATLDAIVALVANLQNITGPAATVGIGIPGTVATTGLVKNANSTWLIGRPLQVDLEARLGRSVRIANDANCFAMSEATDGAASGADVVFGVIVGTGTGAGTARGQGRAAGWGRRHRRTRAGAERRQRHCGRVGSQPLAVAR